MTVYNLKAISCTGGRSSEVLGETYQLDPGPVVEATFPIEGDLSAADLQGDESLLESLLNGIAGVLGLDRERITFVKISDARAANVMLRFVAESKQAADSLAAAARQADYTGIRRCQTQDGLILHKIVESIHEGAGRIRMEQQRHTNET